MLSKWIKESNYTVVLTGAGISTASGIPDFRSSHNGKWKHKNPAKVGSAFALRFNKKEFLQFYKDRIENLKKAKPNYGHEVLSKWEKEGIIKSIVTQNVDGFHQLAGSEKVLELHGTLQTLSCVKCKKTYPSSKYFEEKGERCSCNKFLRPNVVLFGEGLPIEPLKKAREEIQKADLLIVIGTSLQVSPANKLVKLAKENGAKIVIINRDKTFMDDLADQKIDNKEINEVLKEIEIHK